jgi:hypothetical protein
VPGEEVACSVDSQGVLHVDGDEVIVTGLRSRVCCGTELGRRFCDTLNSCNVGLLLSSGNVSPVCTCQRGGLRVRDRSGEIYHSRRTRRLAVVHVFDFAIAASIAGRPLAARSDTASAAQRTESSEAEASRAYNALKDKRPAIVRMAQLDC